MGWVKRIFGKGKGKEVQPQDFSLLHTDVHSHLIPGIDDGAKSLDESIRLIQGLQSLGYKKLITTPHIMSDYYKNDRQKILSGLHRVQEALKLHKIDIELEAAAEYYLDENLFELIKNKEILTFGDNMLLFELSFFEEPKVLDQAIFNMQLEGYKPVLAHPERYPYYHRSMEKYQKLIDKGVLFQINLGSLSGNYGMDVMKVAEKMIENEWVSLVGSDTHHMMHIQLFSTLKTNPILHRLLNEQSLLNPSL